MSVHPVADAPELGVPGRGQPRQHSGVGDLPVEVARPELGDGELAMLRLLARGWILPKAARHLGLTEYESVMRCRALYRALGARRRGPAMRRAAALALVTREEITADRTPQHIRPLGRQHRVVLDCFVRDMSNPEISSALGLGRQTGRRYAQELIEELGAHSRWQAVLFAFVDGHLEVSHLLSDPARQEKHPPGPPPPAQVCIAAPLLATPALVLSKPELGVLRLIAEGLTQRQIAARRRVALSTVQTQEKALRQVLRAGDRGHAVTIGLAHGVLTSRDMDLIRSRDGIQPQLTQRQRAVLSGLARGLTYEQIATELHLTLGAARTSGRELMADLGTRTRCQSVARAAADGLIDPAALITGHQVGPARPGTGPRRRDSRGKFAKTRAAEENSDAA
ncbi:helix-turn-helix transcriptional regulator [Kitasatospora sp. NPDC001664]